jgi:5-methylcytosine-specific restriction endonuclease McrA
MTAGACTWCGEKVDADDGWRASEPAGERRATFCRLEHVFPWWVRGPHWEAGTLREPPHLADDLTQCAHCGQPLPDKYVLLVRHRGDHRIPDAFCSVEHMAQWAKGGGRWQ